MSKNHDKTVCCRVESDFYQLLDVITKHKGQKLSEFIRDLLNNAVALELRQLGILSSSQVEAALNKYKDDLGQSLGELTATTTNKATNTNEEVPKEAD